MTRKSLGSSYSSIVVGRDNPRSNAWLWRQSCCTCMSDELRYRFEEGAYLQYAATAARAMGKESKAVEVLYVPEEFDTC